MKILNWHEVQLRPLWLQSLPPALAPIRDHEHRIKGGDYGKTELWLSSAAVKHFSVIFHLHLLTLKLTEVSPTAFLAHILSLPRLEDLVTTYLLVIKALMELYWLSYYMGICIWTLSYSLLATRIQLRKLLHETSQRNMQILTGHNTEAWIKTIQKIKTEHRHFRPDQKNGTSIGLMDLVFCSCASQKHQSWHPTCI